MHSNAFPFLGERRQTLEQFAFFHCKSVMFISLFCKLAVEVNIEFEKLTV